MTLEPVHMQKIADLAHRIDSSFEPSEETKTAVDIYMQLASLELDGKVVLQAVDRVFRGKVRKSLMAQCEDPFSVTYACDSGSTNPKTYDSGLFVDFCHCALAATPTNLDLQRFRTIVCAAYSSSQRTVIPSSDGWESFDDGMGRAKLIKIEYHELKNKVPDLVHNMAMYLAESEHILFMLEWLEKQGKPGKLGEPGSGFFILDGPMYPKQLLYWMVLKDEEVRLQANKHALKVLQNYIDIVDYFLEKRAPMIGFVKNPIDKQLMDTIRKKYEYIDLPWIHDSQFFKIVLDPEKNFPLDGKTNSGSLNTNRNACKNAYSDFITYTSWFLQPNRFYEKLLRESSPLAAEKSVNRELSHKFPPEDYAVCFFMAYVPSKTVLFKIEAPYGLIKDKWLREQITKKVLFDLALHDFPITLFKADHVAKIRKVERENIEKQFKNMNSDTTYNDIRWGKTFEV